MEKVLLEKSYEGFESWSDIDRDISEMWDDSNIPAEGTGTVIIKIVYVENAT